MKTLALIVMTMLMIPCLSGCETIKGTVSGAGSGIAKDCDNTVQAARQIPPKVMELDAWIHKNMW